MMACFYFVLISLLSIIEGRPEPRPGNIQQSNEKSRPEEKFIFPEKPTPPYGANPNQQSNIENKTREILRKIEEVNTKQGYHRRKWKPKYSRPPYSYYSRSQFQNEQSQVELLKLAMANPILEYLKSQNQNTQATTGPRLRMPFNHQSTENKIQDSSANQDVEEVNQPIRQVTHYQVIALPSYFNPQMNNVYDGFPPPNYQQLPNPPAPYDNSFYNPGNRGSEASIEINRYDTSNIRPESRQNWNWPGANLFPIYIRDPFLQMYYAVTNMIEYGPNAGSGGPCKLTPTRGKIANEVTSAKGKDHNEKTTVSSRMANAVEILNNPLSSDYLDVEDILTNAESDLSFKVKNTEPIQSREATGNEIIVKSYGKPFIYTAKNAKSNSKNIAKQHSDVVESPPHVTPDVFLDSVEETELEAQKNDINVSNEASKKVFSRENTGNGIFIHKIKVKQGGVAIAGPGGIASAGEGGTAIVGPNGIAYTTAQGTAIAGSGGKVHTLNAEENAGLIDIIKTAIENSTTKKVITTERIRPENLPKPNLNNKPNRPINPFFNFNSQNG